MPDCGGVCELSRKVLKTEALGGACDMLLDIAFPSIEAFWLWHPLQRVADIGNDEAYGTLPE